MIGCAGHYILNGRHAFWGVLGLKRMVLTVLIKELAFLVAIYSNVGIQPNLASPSARSQVFYGRSTAGPV